MVTEIGGSVPISEASVEAGNWMTALKLARTEIGEAGGIPPGASAQVATDGTVTIHDATARRTYVLAPAETTSLKDKKAPKGPRVPSEDVPRKKAEAPESERPARDSVRVPKPSDPPPAQSAAPKKPSPKKTIAYNAQDLGVAPPGGPKPAAAKPEASPKKTIAYNAQDLGIAPPAGAPAEPAEPAEEKPEAKADTAKAEAKADAAPPKKTIAYNAQDLGIAPPGAKPEAPAEAEAKPEPETGAAAKKTIAYDAQQLGIAPPAGEAPSPDAEQPRVTVPDASPAWELLHSRDDEPSEDSPLCYRERTYYVPDGTSAAVVETILTARFEEIRGELEGRPKGKLVNMAIFDHRWKNKPSAPPLLTLQWKDWRGEPVIARPGKPKAEPGGAKPAPATAGGAAKPAPKAPKPAQKAEKPAPEAAKAAPEAAKPAPAPAPAPEAAESAPAPANAPEPAPAAETAKLAAEAAEPAPPQQASAGSDELELSISDDVVDRPAPAQPAPRARRRTDEVLANAFEALQDLFFLTTPIEGLEFVVRLLNDLVPAEAYSACLYDINADELRFVAVEGPGADPKKGAGVPRLTGLIGVAALAPDKALLVEDVSDDPRFDAASDGRDGLKPETMALMAITHQGRLLGMLQVINRRQQAQFSRADANLLAYVSEKLGEFLFAARMRPDERHA